MRNPPISIGDKSNLIQDSGNFRQLRGYYRFTWQGVLGAARRARLGPTFISPAIVNWYCDRNIGAE